jgi:hypothetical protein
MGQLSVEPPPQWDDPDEEVLAGPDRRGALSQPWLILTVVAAGLAALVVRHAGGTSAPDVVVAPSVTRTAVAPSVVATKPLPFTYLTTTARTCSARDGRRLVLGAEIENQGSTRAVLTSVTPIFPLHGLHAVKTQRGWCGQLRAAEQIPRYPIAPGASVWITTTVDVQVVCPAPLPVLLDVAYRSELGASRVLLTGFADLGTVPYPRCKT